MKSQRSGAFRFILIFALVLVLIRFFPIVLRASQVTASAARGYWLAIIPLLVIGWVIWRLKNQASVLKKSEFQFEHDSTRDVTNSTPGGS